MINKSKLIVSRLFFNNGIMNFSKNFQTCLKLNKTTLCNFSTLNNFKTENSYFISEYSMFHTINEFAAKKSKEEVSDAEVEEVSTPIKKANKPAASKNVEVKKPAAKSSPTKKGTKNVKTNDEDTIKAKKVEEKCKLIYHDI